MKSRSFRLHKDARGDLVDTWRLIYNRDGAERADGVYARIEAFCRSLGEFAEIGTRHDDRRPGLRSVGIPGLRTVTILFLVESEHVTVLRIGYLGRDVWARIPT
jgi:toxin ParE1/3/4